MAPFVKVTHAFLITDDPSDSDRTASWKLYFTILKLTKFAKGSH